LPASRRSDGPIEEQAGREMFVEPLEGANDTLAHSERSKGPVGNVGGDGVEAFLDITPCPTDLRFLRPLGREVGVFDFKRERAENLGAVPARDATDE
jgi:hypothetical protein